MRRRHTRRAAAMRRWPAVLAALAALAAPAPAAAAIVGAGGGELTYGAADGERNDLTIALDGGFLVVSDPGASELQVYPGCAATADPRVARCARRPGSRGSGSVWTTRTTG